MPGWRPGDPSPRGEARKFLGWYLDMLTRYQNWQVRALRRSYDGPVAMLYASWGMRPGDFDLGASRAFMRMASLSRK